MLDARSRRSAAAVLAVALVAGGAAACGPDGAGATAAASASATATPAPEPFGTGGYRGLKLGMTKDEALATGALETAPVSLLNGCTDYAYKGGPAPDQVRMAAEDALRAKYVQADARSEETKQGLGPMPTMPPDASTQQVKDYVDQMGRMPEKLRVHQEAHEQLMKVLDEMKTARETRDKAFLATGRAGFGTQGLRELVAPAGTRTAEGIGAGSTLDELKQAYDAKGLKAAERDGRFEMPAEGRQSSEGWVYEFTVDGAKVAGLALVKRGTYCS
ncbi:hypothetical protein [Kitasatospora sp. NPDC090091]|uniref:hypothetical protein n=1 Tax=Kitasatospora sp. NPDC090091 TaxID=3364081 RepID=UPI003821CE6A